MSNTAKPGRRLTGRHILITGAASGIGRAVAELFAAEGARTALLDCDADRLAAVAAATGGRAVVADVAAEASVRGAVAAAAKAMGGIDGIVNSAGVAIASPLGETDTASWRRALDVNLTGPFLICREALDYLRLAPAATIVNIASGQALLPAAGAGPYAASKGGLVAFTKVLAAELAPKIRANAICPGMVDTPMVAAAKNRGLSLDPYALKRMADPAELAAAILFLTSAESSFVTGVTLAVDGGRTYH